MKNVVSNYVAREKSYVMFAVRKSPFRGFRGKNARLTLLTHILRPAILIHVLQLSNRVSKLTLNDYAFKKCKLRLHFLKLTFSRSHGMYGIDEPPPKCGLMTSLILLASSLAFSAKSAPELAYRMLLDALMSKPPS